MKLYDFQSDLKDALAAIPALAGLVIMVELDEDATDVELAEQDDLFERTIATTGLVIAISTPRAMRIDQAKLPGGVHLRLLCQVAFMESPKINRMAADPAQPEIVPANKRPLRLIRAAIAGLLAAGFEIPEQPLTDPEQDIEGLNLHGLLVTARDDIRAA